MLCGLGANYDWATHFKRRVEGSGALPSVPHFFEHVKGVLGAASIEDCLAIASRFTLKGVLDRIRVPILICHGEDDRQIPVDAAYSTYNDCINSPRREIRIFTREEGGEQHCSFGNMRLATDYMADWIADALRVGSASAPR